MSVNSLRGTFSKQKLRRLIRPSPAQWATLFNPFLEMPVFCVLLLPACLPACLPLPLPGADDDSDTKDDWDLKLTPIRGEQDKERLNRDLSRSSWRGGEGYGLPSSRSSSREWTTSLRERKAGLVLPHSLRIPDNP
jgi:hypothetical protein